MTNSETEASTQDTETELDSGLFMLYGSYLVQPDFYLQGGVGTGKL